MRAKRKLIPSWNDLDEVVELKIEKEDFVYEEEILNESERKIPNKDIQIETKHDKKAEEKFKILAQQNRKNILRNSLLKGLLPNKAEETFLNLNVIKRCCIEHCYFVRNRSRSYRYNLRNSSLNSGSTLQFENENSSEQQTIDCKYLNLQEDNRASLNDWNDKKNIDLKIESKKILRERSYSSDSSSSNSSSSSSRYRSTSSRSRSSSNSESDTLSLGDNSNDQDYLPEDNISESDSDSAERDSLKSFKNLHAVNSSYNNDYGFRKKKIPCNWTGVWRCQKPKIPSDFVSVHDLLTEIKKMQKLLKVKCDKKFTGESVRTGRISSPKLKKMVNNGKGGGDFSKMSKSLYKLPNLTRMVTEEKNWRMEYMDNEIQNLGLDDLLLKASELNAENFTKALGRELDSANPEFNCKDTSEIVFTIPKCKRVLVHTDKSQENEETEFSKMSNSVKLSMTKPVIETDPAKEKETPQEASKSSDEPSFKKPGIKVKTVENINEEFKDSLEVKSKMFQDCNPKNSNSETSSKNDVGEENEKEFNAEEEIETNAEGNPFVLTIIQSKAEKQRPAILRNSTYFKKKTKNFEKPKLPEISEKTTVGQKEETNNLTVINNAENEGKKEVQSLKPKIVLKENRSALKQRNIPFILNRSRKCQQSADTPSVASVQAKSQSIMPPNVIKVHEKSDKTFKVTSIEQKLMPKTVNRRFVKVVPYEPVAKTPKKIQTVTRVDATPSNVSDEELDKNDAKDDKVLSLFAFSNILRDILPEKWFLCLDKKYGLQIIKTQTDEFLNPSILISVVIARCGKLTVNVRGNQLKKNHTLFSNLCSMKNSENKLSLNYVLAVLNKLRCLSVCFGCDDPSLKQYWSGDGFVERHTEFRQVYRSHFCQLLISLGKKRCYPCYRMNEAFKNRYRKDKLGERPRENREKESSAKEGPEEVEDLIDAHKGKGVKRNLEDFLEESFSTMKQQITDEIEKNKKLGEREKALKAQEEVLSFMGLARKERLDNPVRKSKRKKNSFYKFQQPVKKKIDQQELEFLEKYWSDINTLFSTSLLFGAYSRTGRSRLREKCRMFHSLLSTWKQIMRTNPEWIGDDITLPGESSGKETPEKDSGVEHFDKMDVPALRAYIINSVKEVNRLKHKLRTRNSYFKILYNKFVKRRIKRPKTSIGSLGKKESSTNSTTNTPTPTDFSSDDSAADKKAQDAVSAFPVESIAND